MTQNNVKGLALLLFAILLEMFSGEVAHILYRVPSIERIWMCVSLIVAIAGLVMVFKKPKGDAK